MYTVLFFFSSRRRHTRSLRDWSSDVCSSDLSEAERLSDLGEIDHEGVAAHADQVERGNKQASHQRHHENLGPRWEQRVRSEERRVGKECRYRWSTCNYKIQQEPS